MKNFLFDCFVFAKKQINAIDRNLLYDEEFSEKSISHLNTEWIDKIVYKDNLVGVVNDLRKQIVETSPIDFLMENRKELGIIWERFCPVFSQPEITGYYESEDGGLYYGTYALSQEGDFVAYADGIRIR